MDAHTRASSQSSGTRCSPRTRRLAAGARGAPRWCERHDRRTIGRLLCRPAPCRPTGPLAAEAETGDQAAVALDVVAAHVVEQATAMADELHQPAASVMVTFVRPQVLGEVIDALREDRHLDLRRASVRLVEPVLGDCR